MKPRGGGPVKVALVGLGPIGLEIGKALLAEKDAVIVAAADVSPIMSHRRLGEFLPGTDPAVIVDSDLGTALGRGIDVAVVATSSWLPGLMDDLRTAIENGVHVVSTCEELAAPGVHAELWKTLDEEARQKEVSILGTGVNPGFVMDRLVLSLAGACVRVERVEVERVVDAAKRRGPLRRKVGEGLTAQAFREGVAEGRIGHVGLRQSAELIARGLGWTLDRYEEKIEPVLDNAGRGCLGLQQIGFGLVGGQERITLRLQMSVGADEPHDRVRLTADPPLDVLIVGGVQGDRGTIGTVVQALRRIVHAPPGLLTVADLFV